MHILATYPSGVTLSLHGDWKLVETETDLLPTMTVDAVNKDTREPYRTTFVLDRRAIVMDGIRILYSPRRNTVKLSEAHMAWLEDHPEWDKLPDANKKRS